MAECDGEHGLVSWAVTHACSGALRRAARTGCRCWLCSVPSAVPPPSPRPWDGPRLRGAVPVGAAGCSSDPLRSGGEMSQSGAASNVITLRLGHMAAPPHPANVPEGHDCLWVLAGAFHSVRCICLLAT